MSSAAPGIAEKTKNNKDISFPDCITYEKKKFREAFMKKTLAFILSLFCMTVMLGCQKKPPENNLPTDDEAYSPASTDRVYEELSEEDFFSVVDGYDNGTYESLYVLEGKKYGRIISSSTSPENAVEIGTRHFTDERSGIPYKNIVLECNVIYESDLFYGVYVKWKVHNTEYEENVISFKKSLFDITVRNAIYGDIDSYTALTDDEDSIETLLLYLFHHENSLSNVIDYETKSGEREFEMTVYSYDICYGDWDMEDEYRLLRQKITVNKESGEITFQEETVLKTLYR